MVRFRLSAFSDEYSPTLDGQIEGLQANRIRMTELRGVDGVNVSDLTPDAAQEIRRKLDAHGIAVSAVGSPIGKIAIDAPFAPHLDKLKNTCEVAAALGTGRVRMFSFYVPEGKEADAKDEVIDRVGQLLDAADGYGVTLCHENEKGIYGSTPERCLDLLDAFPGRLGCVFDPANFIQCGCAPFEHCYNLLKRHITYMHVKDALKNGTVVPSGMGAGCIPELLAVINQAFTGDFVLSLEPHLRVFAGLEQLEAGHRSVVGSTYETAAEAFAAAAEHLRWCIPRTAELV